MAARAGRLVGLAVRGCLHLFLAVLLTLSVVPSASAGSNTWTRLPDPYRVVGGLAVAPSDPSLLYARTPQGLFRSSDRGRTWRLVGRRLGLFQSDGCGDLSLWYYQPCDNWGVTVRVDPKDPRIVYSTLDESQPRYLRGYYPSSVERSADGGRTWRRVLAQDGGDVTIYPGDPRIAYVAGQDGVWKSVDRGLTWSQVYYLGATDLAVGLQDPNLVLALAGDYLVKSTDGGRTWASLPRPGSDSVHGSAGGVVVGADGHPAYWSDDGETWATDDRWVNPLDPSESFTPDNGKESGAIAVIRSTDWGRTRTLLPYPPTQTYVRQLVLDRGSPQTMYALADDGLWAYSFGDTSIGAAGGLPRTGSPDGEMLAITVALAAALSLVGLRLRRRGVELEPASRAHLAPTKARGG